MGGVGGSPSERRMFVTSTIQSANLGGIAGADALCATQADGAGLDGNFEAWLSTLSSSVSDRLSHEGGPFVLVNATVVANDWEDLVDGALLAPINLDAMGQAQTGDVWTGTLPTGASYAVDDCTAFTSASTTVGQALCGSSTSITTTWTQSQTPRCSTLLRLYCIEQ
jgi:Collagenase NC10 and Endostatin